MSASEEPIANKRAKEDGDQVMSTVHDKTDVSLNMFDFERVLNDNSKTKWIAIEAKHCDQKAVIVLEKLSFNEENVKQILSDQSSSEPLRRDFCNDIYGNYFAYPRSELNAIKTTVIHPATDKHIQKYLKHEVRAVLETPELYQQITLPHIQSQQFSLQWVQNILDHKSETERIVCDDEDPEVGFVLLPDMKWDGIQLESLYMMAIARKNGIKSIRDLDQSHLPLLHNIKNKCLKVIEDKYGLKASQMRVYLHYQPSYYHLHIHFTSLDYENTSIERNHLLDNVINNINIRGDYYQKSNLLFPISCSQNNPLYKAFSDINII